MLTLTKIYEEITKKKTKETSPKSENNWTPRRCETYILPSFRVPKSRAKAAQRKKFSMVLAFVRRVRNIRAAEGCTIMPIPTTNKSMIAIAGSVANASNLIKFMLAIGLISVESDKFQFGSRSEKYNHSKTYRYYYENEVRLLEYCKQEGIQEFLTKNRMKGKKYSKPKNAEIGVADVAISAHLRLKKPRDMSKAEFEDYLTELLYEKYPDLDRYQRLADEINETYYTQTPEFAVTFRPNFTWDKSKTIIQKIGIRATNQCVSASNQKDHENFHRIIKQDLLDKHSMTLSKDVKSSVPRITLSLNQHFWEKENTDIYERIYHEYIHSGECPTGGTVVQKFAELRPAIKALHMRGYFDAEKDIRNHTCYAMETVENRQEVYDEMKAYQKAVIKAEGGKLYGTEIFLHESCIYLDVLKELLDNGFFCWECYDAFYARKEGVTQEEFEQYVEALVEEKANAYIKRYDEIMASQRFSEIS